MKTTSTFDYTLEAYNDGHSLIINRGGTRSGKSFAILQILALIAIYGKRRRIITCVSHSFPHLEMGIVRDFDNILLGEGIIPDQVRTKKPYVYKLGNSIVEFLSVDNMGKALGAARNILFVNEANKVKHEIYHHLMIRTTETIFIDFNPAEKFWLSKHGYDKEAGSIEIVSTYLSNIRNLTIKQIEELERAKKRAEKEKENGKEGYWCYWWNVYGEGNYGRLVDRMVFPNFITVKDIPKRFKLKGYGLDFGFANDPCAVTAVYVDGEDVLFKQLLYKTGVINLHNPNMPNKSLEIELKRLTDGSYFIVADSAEPKSIAELRGKGFKMYAVRKPKILDGIRNMLKYRIFVTEDSPDIINELEGYLYPVDKDDQIIEGNPVGEDHAIDGAKYFLWMKGRIWK